MMSALKIYVIVATVAAALSVDAIKAQQPTPPMIVVQPAGAAPAATPSAAASDSAVTAAIKALEEVKAANDATLKKQQAMLQQLDELQKAAEQLKVFSKRV
jgi:hypothetical protein